VSYRTMLARAFIVGMGIGLLGEIAFYLINN